MLHHYKPYLKIVQITLKELIHFILIPRQYIYINTEHNQNIFLSLQMIILSKKLNFGLSRI